MSRASGTTTVEQWDEKAIEETKGQPKITGTHVRYAFTGDIEGEAITDYLMIYRNDDSASFVGLRRIKGKLGDRTGSFVVQETGSFEKGVANADWTIVPGSGTEKLKGIKGEGTLKARQGATGSYELSYEFA